MLDTSLIQGLEVIAIVSVMTTVLSPILCWVLTHPLLESKAG
ncbi:MAG: hypothetical protein ACFBSG_09050 [Leptolyngbyaceae cyanobacterium]